jgi:hypothetical protein
VRELLSKIEGDDDAEEEKLRVRHHLEFLLLCDKDDTYVRTYILCVWRKKTLVHVSNSSELGFSLFNFFANEHHEKWCQSREN